MCLFFFKQKTAYEMRISDWSSDVCSSDLHGVIMVWFFLIPSIPATLGNFLLPLMIGARDLAFPRLNLWSWYVYVIGGLFTLATLIAGGVDTGWTFYTPYSTLYSNSSVMLAVCGVKSETRFVGKVCVG